MEQVVCEVEVRKSQGKGAAHKLRRSGSIPAILYSKGGDNTMLQVEARELARILSTGSGQNIIINLKIKGNGAGDATAMITEVQRDTFQKHILHVDFRRIRMDETVHSTVRIVFHGHAAGVEGGGMVDHLRNEIEVEALPTALPDRIEIDVTGLGIGDSLRVGDLKLPAGVIALTDAEEMIVIVHSPRTQETSATEEAATVADTTLGAAPAAG